MDEQRAREDYWTALCEADRHAALAALRRLHAAGVPAMRLVDELVVPAQLRIGDLWLAGEWSIAQEHAATAINEGLVHWLASFSEAPDDDRPPVVVSCVEGEHHALAALVVAEGLVEAGFRVHYVGGDPEPGDLLRQVVLLQPRAVCFSASLASSLATTTRLFGSIRALGIPVVVGGRAFGGHPQRALALGATAYAEDLPALLRVLAELPARDEDGSGTGPGATTTGLPTSDVPTGEDEAAWIVEHRGEITPAVVRAVAGPPAPAPPEAWQADLAGHVRYLLGSLAASLVAHDEAILLESRDWLGEMLDARGAPQGALHEVWIALGVPLRDRALARLVWARAAPGYRDTDVSA